MATVKDLRGREIVVNVGHGEDGRDQSPAAKRRKGSPQTSKARDGILHRRKKNARIRFYDLSYMRQPDGSYRRLLYPPRVQETITDADYLELINAALGEGLDRSYPLDRIVSTAADYVRGGGQVPVALHVTTFRRDYALRGVFLPPDDPDFVEDWTTDGLAIEPADLNPAGSDIGVVVVGSEDGDGIVATDADNVSVLDKITNSPNYSAPAVAFTPSLDMDVFIIPPISVIDRYSSYFDFHVDGGGTELYIPGPKLRGIANPLQRYIVSSPGFGSTVLGNYHRGFTGSDLTSYAQAWNAIQNVAYGFGFPEAVSNTTVFPIPPASPSGVGFQIASRVFVGGVAGTAVEHRPKLIIRKRSAPAVLYYVWGDAFE